MNKADIIARISQETSLSKRKSALALNAMLTTMIASMEAGEEVILPGFGIFSVKENKARRCRNPKTGEGMIIPARKSVRFRPGQNLKQAVSIMANEHV
jgi:DNA-binding protein HU-beta